MNFKDKKVLVTGGTGSIGKHVVLKLLNEGADVVVFSRSEDKHDKFDRWLSNQVTRFRVKHAIGDIRSYSSMVEASDDCDAIFHCAAMKYVGLCEENPYEAIQTNLIGAQNVRNVCFENQIDVLVVTGTDKSANPKGVMGLTKHLQERLFLVPEMVRTRVVITRFGNVVGSEGSVVWKFKEDFEAGRQLQITNPDMTRYIITPTQAADILLWAFESAQDRSIVSMKMPMCNTRTLAEAVCDSDDINAQFKGVQKGEKFFEDLFDLDEYKHVKLRESNNLGTMIIYNDGFTEQYLPTEQFALADRHQVRQILKDAGVVE